MWNAVRVRHEGATCAGGGSSLREHLVRTFLREFGGESRRGGAGGERVHGLPRGSRRARVLRRGGFWGMRIGAMF